MEITRLTRGFWLSSGTLKIQSGSRSPELSQSICLKRAQSFCISFSLNWLGNSVLPIQIIYKRPCRTAGRYLCKNMVQVYGNRLSPHIIIIKDMHRNNRNEDYNRINKRKYNYREEDKDEENWNASRNNRSGPYPNQRIKKHNNGHARQNQNLKTDPFNVEQLRNLVKLKKPKEQNRQDFKKDQAKNQCVAIKQPIPRGGKIYTTPYEKQRKNLNEQMQWYKEKGKMNNLQQQKKRKVNSNRNSDDSDWDLGRQSSQVLLNQKREDRPSLSFSMEIPPLQVAEIEEVKPQEKMKIKQLYQQNVVRQSQKLRQINKEQKQNDKVENIRKEGQKIKKINSINIVEQTKKQIEKNKLQEPIKLNFNAQPQSEEIKQQVIVFQKLIDAIDFHQEQKITSYRGENKDIGNKPQEQQKIKSDKQAINKEQLIRLGSLHKRAKIFLNFQAIQNIQSFTIKEIQLRQIGLSLKLDSDGRPKIKESYNITTQQLNRYILFFKTSHYFPKLGRFQEQAQHFVDVAENRKIVLDQTNEVEFQFCQIKVSELLHAQQKKGNKCLIDVNIVSLVCMICGSKNQVVVLQNDMTAVCSCKGKDCSQRIFGRFGKVRVEILQT